MSPSDSAPRDEYIDVAFQRDELEALFPGVLDKAERDIRLTGDPDIDAARRAGYLGAVIAGRLKERQPIARRR